MEPTAKQEVSDESLAPTSHNDHAPHTVDEPKSSVRCRTLSELGHLHGFRDDAVPWPSQLAAVALGHLYNITTGHDDAAATLDVPAGAAMLLSLLRLSVRQWFPSDGDGAWVWAFLGRGGYDARASHAAVTFATRTPSAGLPLVCTATASNRYGPFSEKTGCAVFRVGNVRLCWRRTWRGSHVDTFTGGVVTVTGGGTAAADETRTGALAVVSSSINWANAAFTTTGLHPDERVVHEDAGFRGGVCVGRDGSRHVDESVTCRALDAVARLEGFGGAAPGRALLEQLPPLWRAARWG